MGVDCMILNTTNRDYVQGGPCQANDNTAYGSGAQLRPVEREGGTNGNPDPCFILNVLVLADPNFAAAQPYLSGLPILNSSDPNFPGPMPDPDE